MGSKSHSSNVIHLVLLDLENENVAFFWISTFFFPLWCSLNKCLSRRMRSTNRMVGLKRRKTAFLWTCTSFKLHADNPLILLLLSLCPAFICLSFFCQNGPEAWCLMLDVCWFFLLLFYFHVIVRHREQKVNNKVLVVFEVFFFLLYIILNH